MLSIPLTEAYCALINVKDFFLNLFYSLLQSNANFTRLIFLRCFLNRLSFDELLSD